MTIFGYCRISSASQTDNSSLETQETQLREKGKATIIRREQGSASSKENPILRELIDGLEKGDTLVVAKFDRFSRSTLTALKLIDEIHKKDCFFSALDLPQSLDPNTNKMYMTILSSVAEFDQSRRKERQRLGIAAAREKGYFPGRTSVITPKLVEQVRYEYEVSHLSVSKIAKIHEISRTTVYKLMRTQLNYSSGRIRKLDPKEQGDPK